MWDRGLLTFLWDETCCCPALSQYLGWGTYWDTLNGMLGWRWNGLIWHLGWCSIPTSCRISQLDLNPCIEITYHGHIFLLTQVLLCSLNVLSACVFCSWQLVGLYAILFRTPIFLNKIFLNFYQLVGVYVSTWWKTFKNLTQRFVSLSEILSFLNNDVFCMLYFFLQIGGLNY